MVFLRFFLRLGAEKASKSAKSGPPAMELLFIPP
jgi:hypothetical protein